MSSWRSAPRQFDEVTRSWEEASDCRRPRKRVRNESTSGRVAAGLGGDALDDGQQVLRAMADLPEQGSQRLLPPLLLGGLHSRRDDASCLAVIVPVRIDPQVEPACAVGGGHAYLHALGDERCKHAALCRGDAFDNRRRQKLGIGGAWPVCGRPAAGHIARPHHPQFMVLIKNGNARVAQSVQQARYEVPSPPRFRHRGRGPGPVGAPAAEFIAQLTRIWFSRTAHSEVGPSRAKNAAGHRAT